MEKKRSTKKKITLLQAVEKVITLTEDSKLDKKILQKVKPYSSFIAESYGITEMQAVLFCVCLEKGPNRVDFNNLARFLDLNCIHMYSYADDIAALVNHRLLRYRNAKTEDEFDVYQPVIKALRHNQAYRLPAMKGLNCAQLFDQIDSIFDDLGNNSINPEEAIRNINQLFEDNGDIKFVKEVKRRNLGDESLLLLMLFCQKLIIDDDDDIRFPQMEDIFESTSDFNECKAKLRNGEHVLMERNLVEHICVNGIADNSRYKLTEEAKRSLLSEMKINANEEKIADLLQHSTITAKELFYTQSIEDELQELLPEARILRMDADTTEGRVSHEKLLDSFAKGKADILLGTQMVAKGLDFDNVTLVGVLEADLSLYCGDYHATERTFSLLAQVVGRAGRRTRPGRAVIQTYTPEHPVIQAAAAQDYDAFYEQEILTRQALKAPPFADQFVFRFGGTDEHTVQQAAQVFAKALATQLAQTPDVEPTVLGPVPAPIAKLNKRYFYTVSFRGRATNNSRALVSRMLAAYDRWPGSRSLTVSADIDPYYI